MEAQMNLQFDGLRRKRRIGIVFNGTGDGLEFACPNGHGAYDRTSGDGCDAPFR